MLHHIICRLPSNYEIMLTGDGVNEKEKASKLLYNSKCSRRVFCISKPVTKDRRYIKDPRHYLWRIQNTGSTARRKYTGWQWRAGSKKANTYHQQYYFVLGIFLSKHNIIVKVHLYYSPISFSRICKRAAYLCIKKENNIFLHHGPTGRTHTDKHKNSATSIPETTRNHSTDRS